MKRIIPVLLILSIILISGCIAVIEEEEVGCSANAECEAIECSGELPEWASGFEGACEAGDCTCRAVEKPEDELPNYYCRTELDCVNKGLYRVMCVGAWDCENNWCNWNCEIAEPIEPIPIVEPSCGQDVDCWKEALLYCDSTSFEDDRTFVAGNILRHVTTNYKIVDGRDGDCSVEKVVTRWDNSIREYNCSFKDGKEVDCDLVSGKAETVPITRQIIDALHLMLGIKKELT